MKPDVSILELYKQNNLPLTYLKATPVSYKPTVAIVQSKKHNTQFHSTKPYFRPISRCYSKKAIS